MYKIFFWLPAFFLFIVCIGVGITTPNVFAEPQVLSVSSLAEIPILSIKNGKARQSCKFDNYESGSVSVDLGNKSKAGLNAANKAITKFLARGLLTKRQTKRARKLVELCEQSSLFEFVSAITTTSGKAKNKLKASSCNAPTIYPNSAGNSLKINFPGDFTQENSTYNLLVKAGNFLPFDLSFSQPSSITFVKFDKWTFYPFDISGSNHISLATPNALPPGSYKAQLIAATILDVDPVVNGCIGNQVALDIKSSEQNGGDGTDPEPGPSTSPTVTPTATPTPIPTPTPNPVFEEVPLTIQEVLESGATGFSRTGVASFGIPFQKGTVFMAPGNPLPPLRIVKATDSQEVSYQTKTLAYWEDGSVKWAFVDLLTSVTAGTKNTSLILKDAGVGSSQGIAPLAYEDSNEVYINTGSLTARIKKGSGFNLFNEVKVGNKTLVNLSANSNVFGYTTDSDAMTPGADTTVEILDNGPVKSIIRAKGSLVTGSIHIIDFTCDIIATRSSNALEVNFTLRNANINSPKHVVLRSVDLSLQTNVTSPTIKYPTPSGAESSFALGAGSDFYIYQAHQFTLSAAVSDTEGIYAGSYSPPTKAFWNDGMGHYYSGYLDNGTRGVLNGSPVFIENTKSSIIKHGYLQASNSQGIITAAAQDFAQMYPIALRANGSGKITASLWAEVEPISLPDPNHPEIPATASVLNPSSHIISWREHQTRNVLFQFDAPGTPVSGLNVAKTIDFPISGRPTDFKQYTKSDVFVFPLLTINEQAEALARLGIANPTEYDKKLTVTRYLYPNTTGGENNTSRIEFLIKWLRLGLGGYWLQSQDWARWVTSAQIPHSDNFQHKEDPGASNAGQLPSSIVISDTQHRYRMAAILSSFIIDWRLAESFEDEGEFLLSLKLYNDMRSAALTEWALVDMGMYFQDDKYKVALKNLIDYIDNKQCNMAPGANCYGWETLNPADATRGYVVKYGDMSYYDTYDVRGFVIARLMANARIMALAYLDKNDPMAILSRGRLHNIALFTANELVQPNGVCYDYFVDQFKCTSPSWAHPFGQGMAVAYKDTGDAMYMVAGIDQIKAKLKTTPSDISHPENQAFLHAVLNDYCVNKGQGTPPGCISLGN